MRPDGSTGYPGLRIRGGSCRGNPDRSCSISRVRSKSSNGPSLAGDTRNRQRLPVFETLHWRQHYAGSNIEAKDKPGLALPTQPKIHDCMLRPALTDGSRDIVAGWLWISDLKRENLSFIKITKLRIALRIRAFPNHYRYLHVLINQFCYEAESI
jgi:hypothetical protein